MSAWQGPRDYSIEFRHAMTIGGDRTGKIVGLVSCGDCAWQATMISDTQPEVEQFLGPLLVDHVSGFHLPVKTTADPTSKEG